MYGGAIFQRYHSWFEPEFTLSLSSIHMDMRRIHALI